MFTKAPALLVAPLAALLVLLAPGYQGAAAPRSLNDAIPAATETAAAGWIAEYDSAAPATATQAVLLGSSASSTVQVAASAQTKAEIEDAIFTKLNEERVAAGLPTLVRSKALDAIARDWAVAQANAGKLSHNPNYAKLFPQGWRIAGENVAWVSGGAENEVAGRMNTGWMNSPGHKLNMLDKDFNRVGIGVAYVAGRGYYATQNFGAY